MAYKRILTVQDISCVGQCSLTVALPVLSACGHEVCVLPTAVLSTHTGGFGKPAVYHLGEAAQAFAAHWLANGIDFDVIYTGYLGSIEAIEATGKIVNTLLAPGGVLVVDPAMADHGKLYSGLNEEYACAMKALCVRADVILPNLTEAVMMTGFSCPDEWDQEAVSRLLSALECPNAVLTGVGFRPEETGIAVRSRGINRFYHHARVQKNYHGTGDLFAAALVGAMAGGKELNRAAEIAAAFTFRCIQNTFEDPAHWYGVKFEPVLPELMEMLNGFEL